MFGAGLIGRNFAHFPRDHALFVGGNDENLEPAMVGADSHLIITVRVRIKLEAEPFRAFCSLPANGHRVLADASGEDEQLELSQRRRERAEFAAARWQKRSTAVRAEVLSLSSNSRMSLLNPETASRSARRNRSSLTSSAGIPSC